MRKVSTFDPRPCFRALFASGALPVATRAEDSLGGALRIVPPIAVLCGAPLAGVFLKSKCDGLLV
ncbi:MAG: hypothetical protein ACLQMG_17375, partial [Terracidiphilus sp.]